MARPKKKPDYNYEVVSNQIIEAVRDAYLHPSGNAADRQGTRQLNLLAEEFGMTSLKIRKILITAGVYQTPTSLRVQELSRSGKTVDEIQTITGLSATSVNGYLPYKKSVYNLKELTLQAERIRKYRSRKDAVEQLTDLLAGQEYPRELLYARFWTAMTEFQNYLFRTVTGQKFRYTIGDDALVFTGKEKPVTKAEALAALDGVLALQSQGTPVSGPRMLRCPGSSCLYPIFVRIGVIREPLL